MAKRLNKQMVLGLTIALMALTTAACVLLIISLPQKDPKPLAEEGERLAKEGKYEDSMKAFSQAARRARAAKDTTSYNKYLQRAGEVALKNGLAREAFQFWQSVLMNDPKNEPAQEQVVKLRLELATFAGGANWSTLQNEAEKLIAINPNNYLGQYADGLALIQQRAINATNAEEGRKKLIAALDGEKTRPEYADALAQFYAENGQMAEAEKVYNVQIADNPPPDQEKLAEAHLNRAHFYLQKAGQTRGNIASATPVQAVNLRKEAGDAERKALDDLEKAAQLAPKNTKVLTGLGRYWQFKQPNATEGQARQAELAANSARARQYYEQAIQAAPDEFDAYQGLAQLYSASKEYDKALQVLKARMDRGYNRKHYLAELDAYRMTALREDAFRINMAKLYALSQENLNRQESEKRRQALTDELTELYNQTVADTSAGESDPRALFMKGRLLMIEGNLNGAIAKIEESQKLYRVVPLEIKQTLGGLYLQTRLFGPAKEALYAVVRQAPANPGIWVMLAQAHLQSFDPASTEYRNELEKAKTAATEALKYDPKNREALAVLARVYRIQGNEQVAKQFEAQLAEGVDPEQLRLRDAALLLSQVSENPNALVQAQAIVGEVLHKNPLNLAALQYQTQILNELYAKADEASKPKYSAEIQKIIAETRAGVEKKLAESATSTQPSAERERYQAIAKNLDVFAITADPRMSDKEKAEKLEKLIRERKDKGEDPFLVASQLFDLYRRLPERTKDLAEQAKALVAMIQANQMKDEEEARNPKPGQEQGAKNLKPEQVAMIDTLFRFALAQKDWPLAKDCVALAVKTALDPSGGQFYQGQLLLARAQESPDLAGQARDEIRLGLKSFPRYAPAYIWLGQASLYLKQYNDAQQAFEEARRLDPRNGMAILGLAMTADAQGDQDALSKYLDSCERLGLQNPWVRDKLTQRQERQDPKKGIAAREARRKENPKDVGNLLMLADLYVRDGQPDNAGKLYEECRKLEPSSLIVAQRYSTFLESKDPPDNATAEKVLRELSQAIDPGKSYEKATAQLLLAAHMVNSLRRTAQSIPPEQLAAVDKAFTDAAKISNHTEVLLNIANYFLRTLRPEEALKWQREALDAVIKTGKVDDQRSLRTTIIETLLGTRDPKRVPEIRKEIAAYRDLFPQDLNADLLEGRASLVEGDDAKAVDSFSKYIKNAPGQPLGYALRGQTYFRGSQWDKAIQDLQELKRIDPRYQNLEGRVLLARALRSTGQTDTCINELQAVLDENPGQTRAIDDLLDVYVQTNRLAAADNLLAAHAEAEPDNPVWPELRSRVAVERKQPDEAVRFARQAAERSKLNPARVSFLLNTCLRLGRFDDLLSFVREKLPPAAQKNSATLSMVGCALAGKQDAEKAIDSFIQALEVDPPDFDAFVGLFTAALRQHLKPDTVAGILKKRLEAKPSDQTVKLVLLMLQKGKGDSQAYARGLKEYIAGLAKDAPTQKRLLVFAEEQLAMTEHIENKNLQEARKLYQQVLEADPENSKALNNLAYLLMTELNDPKAALPYAEKAARLSPNLAGVLDTLGWNHVLLKNYDEAISWLRQALQLDYTIAAIHYHAAEALFRRGGTEGAENKTADLEAAKVEVEQAYRLASQQLARTGADPEDIMGQAIELGTKLGLKLTRPTTAPATKTTP